MRLSDVSTVVTAHVAEQDAQGLSVGDQDEAEDDADAHEDDERSASAQSELAVVAEGAEDGHQKEAEAWAEAPDQGHERGRNPQLQEDGRHEGGFSGVAQLDAADCRAGGTQE